MVMIVSVRITRQRAFSLNLLLNKTEKHRMELLNGNYNIERHCGQDCELCLAGLFILLGHFDSTTFFAGHWTAIDPQLSNVHFSFHSDHPTFNSKPEEAYVRTVNEEVSMPCDGTGQPKPNIFWRKVSFY